MLYFILALIMMCTPIVLIIYVVGILIEYSCTKSNDIPIIKFDAFRKFYSINPERWELEGDYVVCKIDIKRESIFYGICAYNTERFRFGFWDFQRYKIFRNQIEKDKMNSKHMESTAKMLGMVKKDIANMEDLAEQQKKKAMENFDSILKNLK